MPYEKNPDFVNSVDLQYLTDYLLL